MTFCQSIKTDQLDSLVLLKALDYIRFLKGFERAPQYFNLFSVKNELKLKNMKSENLSDLSPAELMKKGKTLKMVLGANVGILSVLAVFVILLFVQKQNTIALPLLVVLFSLSSIVFTLKKQLDDIKAELEKKGNGDMI
jgi:hypothetical protein